MTSSRLRLLASNFGSRPSCSTIRTRNPGANNHGPRREPAFQGHDLALLPPYSLLPSSHHPLASSLTVTPANNLHADMASPTSKSPALNTNMDVDYVVSYRFLDTSELAPSCPCVRPINC